MTIEMQIPEVDPSIKVLQHLRELSEHITKCIVEVDYNVRQIIINNEEFMDVMKEYEALKPIVNKEQNNTDIK